MLSFNCGVDVCAKGMQAMPLETVWEEGLRKRGGKSVCKRHRQKDELTGWGGVKHIRSQDGEEIAYERWRTSAKGCTEKGSNRWGRKSLMDGELGIGK
jgi:hypothetical protein